MAHVTGCNIYARPILQSAYQYLYLGEGAWADIPKYRYSGVEPDRWILRLPQWWEYADCLAGVNLEESLTQFNDNVYIKVLLICGGAGIIKNLS